MPIFFAVPLHRRLSININIIIKNFAINPDTVHEIVHPVQAAYECRLAAAGRSDERGYLLFGNFQEMSVRACFSPYQRFRFLEMILDVTIDPFLRSFQLMGFFPGRS